MSVISKDVLEFFDKLQKDLGRKEKRKVDFRPFILIRSSAGDHGARPLQPAECFWESPDIWMANGKPEDAPAVPPNPGSQAIVNEPNTVYAHVWNLGLAPIAGVQVEWFWFNPCFTFDAAHAHPIGHMRVDLSPRGFDGCHKLVKCPEPWVPVMENGGHECLIARASAFGDQFDAAHQWDARAERHVAQRNVSVVYDFEWLKKILIMLSSLKLAETSIHLIQLGKEAENVLRFAAPDLRLDPKVKTATLARLDLKGGKAAQEALQLIERHGLPKKGLAHVFRLAAFQGNKPLGGYTIILGGRG